MTQIFKLPQILKTLDQLDLVKSMSDAFVNVSKKNVLLPPIGEMLFPKSNGELHIKYGAIDNDVDFVVKLATGFFDNPSKGLPPFSGCMLVFSQTTGILKAVLLEEGELTNHRTAAAGAVAAKLLAPREIKKIGIVGTGVQARLQASYLRKITDCRDIIIWGRNNDKAKHAAQDLAKLNFNCTVTNELSRLTHNSNLIVTTTPTINPLIVDGMINPGTHITAIGSDTEEKCELSPSILAMADIVATDSKEQALERGEISQAIKVGQISSKEVVELGEIIIDPVKGRQTETEITISDLSGVAAQDIIIAKEVTKILEKR